MRTMRTQLEEEKHTAVADTSAHLVVACGPSNIRCDEVGVVPTQNLCLLGMGSTGRLSTSLYIRVC